MTKQLVVSIAPAFSIKPNSFARQFAQAIAENGLEVREFSWRLSNLWTSSVVIFHWPDVFFSLPTGREGMKTRLKLKLLQVARRRLGVRFVWVAHNLWPHDRPTGSSTISDSFLRLLDGVVYLSGASRDAVIKRHPTLANVPALITVHGHYRSEAVAPPKPARPSGSTSYLVFFGQIRRYKNIEQMLQCIAAIPAEPVNLRVVGRCKDSQLAARLRTLAGNDSRVTLDLMSEALSNAEIERVIDDADGVVLPYRDVLNSGAAIHALSRNRPVLVPNIGSLPELRQKVGAQWVHTYEGALTPSVLTRFVSKLRAEWPVSSPDLSAFEWSEIGQQLVKFIVSIADGHDCGRERRPRLR